MSRIKSSHRLAALLLTPDKAFSRCNLIMPEPVGNVALYETALEQAFLVTQCPDTLTGIVANGHISEPCTGKSDFSFSPRKLKLVFTYHSVYLLALKTNELVYFLVR